MATVFAAHCVDSFTLAYSAVGGETNPVNKNILVVTPLRFHRRQLHRLEHAAGHIEISLRRNNFCWLQTWLNSQTS